MSFGWFSWLQAATVAPIEVEAMIGYAGHWHWAASTSLSGEIERSIEEVPVH